MPENYVVLDLEMTGLNPKTDKIIEIGAARVRENKVVDTMETFVNPVCKIPQKITEITGITDEMVKDAPVDKDAVRELIAFCGEDILVGHHIIFDYSFIKQTAINENMTFEKSAVDTLKIARKMMPDLAHKTLEFLCEFYGIKRVNAHRALDDARETKELLECLTRDFYSENAQIFEPMQLCYKAKKQTPATKIQKLHLKELLDYHKISLDICFESLTRSEASRVTDQIIAKYGRINKL